MSRLAAIILFLVFSRAASAQAPGEGGPLRRQSVYRGLFPFYTHEEFEDGSSRSKVLLGLVRAESEPNGDSYHHVLPFYSTSLSDGGVDRSLALYPLLYIGRRSPSKSYDFLLPVFARWESTDRWHLVIWPLFHAAREPWEPAFRFLPVLFRHGAWEMRASPDGGGKASTQRLGVPIFLELFEHSQKPKYEAWTILNAFNFDTETESGLPLGKLKLSTGGYAVHLFPFFFRGKSETGDYFHTPIFGRWSGENDGKGIVSPLLLSWASWDSHSHNVAIFPLYYDGENPSRKYTFYSLLYGKVEGAKGDYEDRYFPLFLSHFGARRRDDGSEDLFVNVLWPLGHYSREGESLQVRALPFYDHARHERGEDLGLGGVLYRFHENLPLHARSHWVLAPLIRWRSSPEGSLAWALPFYYHQSEASAKEKSEGLFLFPFYGRGEHIVWQQKKSEGGSEEGLEPRLPLTESRTEGIFPLLTWWKEHKDAASTRGIEKSLHVSPFLRYRRDDASWDFSIFPSVFFGNALARSYASLYPLFSVETDAAAEVGFRQATSLVQWYDNGSDKYFCLFPLVFNWERDGDTSKVTGPLWWFHYRSSPAGGWFHLIPLGFGEWKDNLVSLGIFPFYLERRYGADPINYWNPARFFFLWNQLSSDQESHWSFLWKLVESTSDSSGDFEFRILHRLFLNRKVKGQKEVILNPFFDYSTDEKMGKSRFSILHFVYRSEVEDGVETKRVFFIPVSRMSLSR